jgi:hypothetical protein
MPAPGVSLAGFSQAEVLLSIDSENGRGCDLRETCPVPTLDCMADEQRLFLTIHGLVATGNPLFVIVSIPRIPQFHAF